MANRVARLSRENERLTALLQAAGIDPAVPPGGPDPVRAETASEEPEEQDYTGLLLDSMSEGFYVVDRSGLTTVCNAVMVRLLGFDHRDELLGRSLHEIVHHSHADGTPYPVACCPIYRAAREGKGAMVAGEVFFRRDGTSFPVEYRAEPVIREGVVLGAICTFVDITDRVEAERQLKESEQRLALALAAGGLGIWDYAPQRAELRWDDRVRALFSLSPGQSITMEANVAAIHPDDRTRVEAAMRDAFDGVGSGDYDVQFRAIGIEDGKERWLEAQGQTMFEHGRPQRFLGVIRDVSEQKQAELHLRLMVNELNHRVKNSLAMVQAVATQTLRGTTDIDAARAAFTERLVALARAHDVLTATRWEGADLAAVVALSVEPIADATSRRVALGGPPVALSPKAVLAFSMALHELGTNAIKYGALSNEGGTVSICWSGDGAPGARRLHFTWREQDGPPVALPKRRGFGSKLIERGLASELQGEVRIDFAVTGVVCTIDVPFPVPVTRSLLDE